MRVLITGGSGQVGFELHRQLATLGEILAPPHSALDLANTDAVSAYLAHHQPDVVINAAGYTAVDSAETNLTLSHRLNAELPDQLADYCQQASCWLVHYSSDYVYSGKGDTAWREDDETSPCNAYGAAKLAGDEAIKQSGCRYLIFRTSWVYSAHGQGFLATMLRLGATHLSLKVVNDQIGAPTPARLIALITQQALTQLNSRQTGMKIHEGIYHLAPTGETSWHAFACEIFRLARRFNLPLAIEPEAVAAISTSDYPLPATRPLNSRLNLAKLEKALEIQLPDWQSQLALTVEEVASAHPRPASTV